MKVGGEVTPETLDPFGIKVYELTESCIHIGEKPKVSMDDMYNDLLNLGKIFGVEDRAEALVADIVQNWPRLPARLKRQTNHYGCLSMIAVKIRRSPLAAMPCPQP